MDVDCLFCSIQMEFLKRQNVQATMEGAGDTD